MRREAPQTPKDLQSHPSLFMMRTGVTPVWRLRHASKAKADVVMRLTPRLLSDDMIGLKQAAIAGLGIVALPGYVCREDVRSGALPAGIARLACRRFHDHGSRSLQAGPAAIGPRLHRSLGGRVPESGHDVEISPLKPPQAAVVKSKGGERCGKVGTKFRQAGWRQTSSRAFLENKLCE